MKIWTKYQALTFAILLILLVADFSQSLLILIYDNLLSPRVKEIYTDQFKLWITALYGFMLFGGFPLIMVVIKLNQNQLNKMNIDRLYVVALFILGLGGLFSLPYNCFAVIALISAVYILFSNDVKFADFDFGSLRTILLITEVLVGILMCAIIIVNADNIKPGYLEHSLRTLLLEAIPFSIYEEAVYRGMLYMFLKDLGLGESKAFYVQAFLFWISHISYLLASPLFFWIILPILSLIFGLIARHSKSLTASTSAHILYNVIASFF